MTTSFLTIMELLRDGERVGRDMVQKTNSHFVSGYILLVEILYYNSTLHDIISMRVSNIWWFIVSLSLIVLSSASVHIFWLPIYLSNEYSLLINGTFDEYILYFYLLVAHRTVVWTLVLA